MIISDEREKKIERAFAYVDEHFDEMIEELKRVASFSSVWGDDEGLEATRKEIVSKMRSVGLSPVLHEVAEGNALIGGDVGEGAAALLFYNHYDVVEGGKPENWRTADPFAPQVCDGRLWGRGVSDDKGPLYSRIHAVQAVLAANGEMPVRVKFLVEGDEETSSPSMTKFAREQADLFREMTKADVCVWENGRNDTAGRPWLRFGVRGGTAYDLRITTAKSDVHGSFGTTIPSASWRMVWALSTLKTPDERIAIEGFYDKVRPTTESDLEVLRAFPYEEEAVRKKLGISAFLNGATGQRLKEQIYLQPALSICAIETGEAHNGVRGIVPRTAYARISFYLVADQDPAELEGMLRWHFDRHGFPDMEISQCGDISRPVRTPVDIPFRARALQAASEVYEQPMIVELTQLGGGPADIVNDVWPDMPIVGFGPGNTEGNHHAPDENLRLEDYRNAVKYLIALFYSYA